MADPKQGDSQGNQTNPDLQGGDIQNPNQQDQGQGQGQDQAQQGAVGGPASGNTMPERERVAAPDSEDLYTVILPKDKRGVSDVDLERKTPTPEPVIEEELPPELPPRTYLQEEYDDVGTPGDDISVASGSYESTIVQSPTGIYDTVSEFATQEQQGYDDVGVPGDDTSLDSGSYQSTIVQSSGGEYDTIPGQEQGAAQSTPSSPSYESVSSQSSFGIAGRKFLYGPYVLSNGEDVLDFEYGTPWSEVRSAVLTDQEIDQELLVTSGPVCDVANKIITSKGKLSKSDIEGIVKILKENAENIGEQINSPLYADIENVPVKNGRNVMTLLHVAYACNVDPEIIAAIEGVSDSRGNSGLDGYSVLDSEGNLPLHFAAACSSSTLLKRCMEKTPNGLHDTANFDNHSPFHIITQNPSCSIADITEFTKRDLDCGIIDEAGRTPLHFAAGNVSQEVLSLLIKHVAGSEEFKDIIPRGDNFGNNLAHYAVENPSVNVTMFNSLKSAGVDLNMRNVNGLAPIHAAASTGRGGVVGTLASCGVDINSANVDGNTALHLAVEHGNKESLLKVLKQRGVNAGVKNNDGRTPMHFAAASGNNDVLKVLSLSKAYVEGIETVSQSLVTADNEGLAPLHLACRNGDKNAFRTLRKAFEVNYPLSTLGQSMTLDREGGNTVNLSSFLSSDILGGPNSEFIKLVQSADYKLSPLHDAVRCSNNGVLRDIVKTAAVTDRLHLPSEHGYNTMQMAAMFGNKDTVKMLAKTATPNDLNFSTSATPTPLNLACLRGNNDVVRGLVSQPGININQSMGLSENTVLHYAVSSGDSALVKRILTRSDVDVNRANVLGQTALHLAVEGGNPQIVNYLLKSGADVNRLDDRGNSVLFSSVVSGGKESAVLDIVDKLISKGADINLDGDSSKILNQCVKCGYNKVLDRFIDLGAEVNQDSQIRPMVTAAISGNSHAVKSLASVGGDVNEKVNDPSSMHNGNPLIMVAVANGDLRTIKALVSEGCNVGQAGQGGNTALHTVVTHQEPEFKQKAIGKLTSRNSIKTNKDILTAKNDAGDTPLHSALVKSDTQTPDFQSAVNMLSVVHPRYVKDVLTSRNKKGETPLHACVGLDSSKDRKEFLSSAMSKASGSLGSVLSAQNINFRTPLHEAIQVSDYASAEIMMRDLSRSELTGLSRLTDVQRNTILHLGIQSCNQDLAKYIIKGLDKSQLHDVVKLKNRDGDTPLHDAIKNGDCRAAELILKNCSRKHLGDVIKAQDSLGNTVLHSMCEQVLVNPELKPKFESLLKLAVKRLGSQDASEIINTRNGNGDTVAHCALTGDLKGAKLLVKKCSRETFMNPNNGGQSLSDCVPPDSKYRKGGIFAKPLVQKLMKVEAKLEADQAAELSSISSGSSVESVSALETVSQVSLSASMVSFQEQAQEAARSPSLTPGSSTERLSDSSMQDFEQQMQRLESEIQGIVSGIPPVSQAATGQTVSPSSGKAASTQQQQEMQR
ncbi:Gp200 [Ehrlichia minasensis]|nr:Gp200 [Ehrlichia minasensis]